MPELSVEGLDAALAALQRVHDATEQLGGTTITSGSQSRYAFGVETGRRHDGRLARRAGGARMVGNAANEVGPTVAETVAGALLEGRPGVTAAVAKIGEQLRAVEQAHTPVESGNLRQSMFSQIQGMG